MSDNSIDIVLSRLSKMIADPKYLGRFGIPANNEKIIQFEKKFKVNLPLSYKRFLLKFNGGMILYSYRNEILKNSFDIEMLKGELVCFLSIEELTERYAELKKREWKVDRNTASPYPVIPFCTLPNNEILVFIHGEKSGNESPVFDAFHEEFSSTWGIVAPDFSSFLADYINALGNPKRIGDEKVGVAVDYLDRIEDAVESPDEILERIESELSERPDDAFCYYERAVAFSKLNNFQDALKAINNAIELSTKDAFYYFIRGEILSDAKQFRAALIDFDIAVKFAPKDTLYLCCRAGTLLELNKLTPALKDCNSAIKLDANNTLSYMIRREIYYLLGMDDKAKADQLVIDKLDKKES